MKKILLIILALLLLASSTNALPWKLNATRDVDWSSYPVQVFTGTTGEELEAFIIAHGAGTYLLKNKVTISEELTISDIHVCIGSSGSHKWVGGTTGPIFEVTMTSGRAINISADYVTLDHPTIHFTNADSTATAICIREFWAEIISPSIYAAKGIAFEIIDDAYYYDISNPNVGMDPTGAAGTVFYFDGPGNGWITGGIVGDGAYGMHLVEGHPMITMLYLINQSTKGIYFNPSSANSCGDLLYIGGCVDFQWGVAVDTTGNYVVNNVNFIGTSFWSKDSDPVFVLNNVHNFRVSDSQGIGSTGNTPILLVDYVDGFTLTNSEVSAFTAGNNGLYVYDDVDNKNIIITNNQFSIASGTGIIFAGSNPPSYTVMMNQATTSGCINATNKFCAYNRGA